MNHHALLHTKYTVLKLLASCFQKIFSPHYKEANDRPSGHGQVRPQGHGWHDDYAGDHKTLLNI